MTQLKIWSSERPKWVSLNLNIFSLENEIQKLVKILSKVRQNLKVKLFSTFKKNNNPNLKAGELETVDLDHIMHFKTTVYSTIMGEIPDDYFDFEGSNSTSWDNESSQEEDNMYSPIEANYHGIALKALESVAEDFSDKYFSW